MHVQNFNLIKFKNRYVKADLVTTNAGVAVSTVRDPS